MENKEIIIIVIGIVIIISLSGVLATMVLTNDNAESINRTLNSTNDTINETLNQTSNETAEEISKKETPEKEKQDPNKYYDPKTGRIHTIENGLDYVLSPRDPGYDEEIKKYR